MLEIYRVKKLFVCVVGMAALLLALPAYTAPFAYVTNSGNVMTVIDTATNTVVDTVNGVTSGNIVVHPDGRQAYVAGLSQIQVFDASSNTVIATVPVEGVNRIAVDPAGSYVYALSGSNLLYIDAVNHVVTASVSLGSEALIDLAVHPAGRYIYISQTGFPPKVLVFDTVTNSVTATVTAGGGSSGIVVHPSGSHVYVENSGIDVIDTASNTVTAHVPLAAVRDITIHPSGAYLYAANSLSDVTVIDTATNTVVSTVSVGDLMWQMALAAYPNGGHVYVVGYSLESSGLVVGKAAVIDTTTNTVTDAVVLVPGVSSFPVDIAIGPLSENVGGLVTGITPSLVKCYNMTTGQVVTSQVQGERFWDCEALGLVVSQDDTINMSVTGTAD